MRLHGHSFLADSKRRPCWTQHLRMRGITSFPFVHLHFMDSGQQSERYCHGYHESGDHSLASHECGLSHLSHDTHETWLETLAASKFGILYDEVRNSWHLQSLHKCSHSSQGRLVESRENGNAGQPTSHALLEYFEPKHADREIDLSRNAGQSFHPRLLVVVLSSKQLQEKAYNLLLEARTRCTQPTHPGSMN
jgi:hypothetical protein